MSKGPTPLPSAPPASSSWYWSSTRGRYAIADLGDIEVSPERPLVEGFDVLEPDIEVKPFGIDLFVDQGIENKGVIGTGTKTEGEGHEAG